MRSSLPPSICCICFSPGNEACVTLSAGRIVHNHCFVCSICKSSLTNNSYNVKENSFFCENCVLKLNASAIPTANRTVDSYLATLVSQPAKFQIANYNINPAPAMSLDGTIPANETIHAALIETTSGMIVCGGFQSGDIRVYRGGSKMVYFTGLKLNKMAPIKADLSSRNIKVSDTTFCVRFSIGRRDWTTETFKIVSSCSQLPNEIRNAVRPAKRPYTKSKGRKKKQSSDEEEQAEESPGSTNGIQKEEHKEETVNNEDEKQALE